MIKQNSDTFWAQATIILVLMLVVHVWGGDPGRIELLLLSR